MAIITLTTDFGTCDGFVGAMKGKILSLSPNVELVDITHDLPPQNIEACSMCLLRSTTCFPTGSIHVVVVDPGVGSDRRALLLKSGGRWYIGPDNGIFSGIVRQCGTEEIYEIHKETEYWQAHSSFDGLALFAPVAAYLAEGLSMEKIGSPLKLMMQILPESEPNVTPLKIEGRILGFDHFGNAQTNIRKDHLSRISRTTPSIICQKVRFAKVNHYLEGREKAAIALINSDGFLELAVFGDSAQKKHNLKKGDTLTIS